MGRESEVGRESGSAGVEGSSRTTARDALSTDALASARGSSHSMLRRWGISTHDSATHGLRLRRIFACPLRRQREYRNRRDRRGLVAPGAPPDSRGCPGRRPARRARAPLPATTRSRPEDDVPPLPDEAQPPRAQGRRCRGGRGRETCLTPCTIAAVAASNHPDARHVRSPPRRGSPPCAAGSRRPAPGARRWGWSPCPGRAAARRGRSA